MNELTWADIDFSLIQPGMITGGGQEGEQQTLISFAEYLNVYAETLKHRYKFFGYNDLSVEATGFQRGGIRTEDYLPDEEGFSLQSFTVNYRRLCFKVFNLLRIRTFYSIEILEDALNASDYELPKVFDNDPETGFAAFMGLTQEEYDIVLAASINTASFYELFTARILRIIFDVFTKYTISNKDYSSNWTRSGRTWIAGPIEENTLTRDVAETWQGSGGDSDSSLSTANTEAYDDYSTNPTQGFRKNRYINSDGARFNSEDQMSYRRVSKSLSSGQYRAVYDHVEGHSLVWSYKNKNDEFVDVQFSMYGVLRSNHDYVSETNTSTPTPDGKFINTFPEVRERLFVSGEDAAPVDVSIDNLRADPEFTVNGVMTTFSLSAQYPVEEMPKSNKYTDGGFTTPQFEQQFWLTSPMFVYADVNSEGFDYYADPELWPADP